ncbi:MAG: class I SAM-dependent methyltransferase [Defluviitaleaceae bacterium]|nr:class I SAM-dependent methyltransferase [Defluviitaleaceae bacterium]
MNDMNRESWDLHASRFYQEDYLSLDDIDFESYDYPTDKDLNIFGDVSGLSVLEIGSGTCNCGIVLAKKGATVKCSDISIEQLKIGEQVAKKAGVNITTACADMVDLTFAKSTTFDLVICMNAIVYAKDFGKVCEEVNRVLKPNGRFVFSATHPVMACVGATDLWPEDNANPNYSYVGPIQWKWNEEDDFVFTTYRMKVSDYVNLLAVNKLYIKRMEELFPVSPLPADCDFDENEIAVRTRFPSNLVIEAMKIDE